MRTALTARRKLRIHHRRLDGVESDRVVRPLGAFLWGASWTFTASCELRDDFRNVRLHRIILLETGEPFESEPGKTLKDFVRRIGPEAERLLGDRVFAVRPANFALQPTRPAGGR